MRKSDGSIRLCGDYKVTINEYLGNIEYPTPNAQDLFATLAGGRRFTRLDLKQAYQQMEVDSLVPDPLARRARFPYNTKTLERVWDHTAYFLHVVSPHVTNVNTFMLLVHYAVTIHLSIKAN